MQVPLTVAGWAKLAQAVEPTLVGHRIKAASFRLTEGDWPRRCSG